MAKKKSHFKNKSTRWAKRQDQNYVFQGFYKYFMKFKSYWKRQKMRHIMQKIENSIFITKKNRISKIKTEVLISCIPCHFFVFFSVQLEFHKVLLNSLPYIILILSFCSSGWFVSKMRFFLPLGFVLSILKYF